MQLNQPCKKSVPELMYLGVRNTGAHRKTAPADGPSYPDDRGLLEGILAHWNRGPTTTIMEGLNRQFLALNRKAEGTGRWDT
jgi:hypothetical protein